MQSPPEASFPGLANTSKKALHWSLAEFCSLFVNPTSLIPHDWGMTSDGPLPTTTAMPYLTLHCPLLWAPEIDYSSHLGRQTSILRLSHLIRQPQHWGCMCLSASLLHQRPLPSLYISGPFRSPIPQQSTPALHRLQCRLPLLLPRHIAITLASCHTPVLSVASGVSENVSWVTRSKCSARGNQRDGI